LASGCSSPEAAGDNIEASGSRLCIQTLQRSLGSRLAWGRALDEEGDEQDQLLIQNLMEKRSCQLVKRRRPDITCHAQ